MEDEKYLKAKKRVKDMKDFYIHLAVFSAVMVVIIVINVATYAAGRSDNGEWNFWFLYPFGFWGFAVLMHGLRTFVFGNESTWERKKIRELMDKMDKEK